MLETTAGRMSDTSQNASAKIESRDRAFFAQLVLARATVLARKGLYSASESLLKSLPDGDKARIPVLDLLARIHAQNGRFSDAEHMWKRIIEIDSANQDGLRGIRRVAKMRNRPTWLPSALVILATAVLAALMGTAIYVSHYVRQRQLSARSQTGEGMIRDPKPDRASPGDSGQILPNFMSQGVQVRKTAQGVEIVFEKGLFLHGIKFRPDGISDLSRLADQLRRSGAGMSLTLEGSSDDVPVHSGSRYSDNLALRLARSESVFREMVRAGADADAFSFKSLSNAPFANDSPENRARNRTVIIFVSPGQEKLPEVN
jgi:flagellar motor protein MotB